VKDGESAVAAVENTDGAWAIGEHF
jgi:hypothetical protein